MVCRILYFGLPLGALYLEAHGYRPVAACIGHRDAPGMRRLGRRLPHTLRLVAPDLEDPRVQNLLASCAPDAILSFFFPRRIPGKVLGLAPLGAYGTHPSLLPTLRGPDPYFWAILHGHAHTGVTLHQLEEQYDTGAIVSQRSVPIGPQDTAWSLAKKLDRPALELLRTCAEHLHRGLPLAAVPQDSAHATQAPEPDAETLRIDWNSPSDHIERLVRAAAPYPGATALLGAHLVALLRVRATDEFPGALAPGEAYVRRACAVVRTGSSALVLEQARDLDTERMLDSVALADMVRAGSEPS